MKFKNQNTYTMRSVCDYNCTWSFKVIRRTKKTVTLKEENGQEKTCRVRIYEGNEQVMPLGSYSMAPVLDSSDR